MADAKEEKKNLFDDESSEDDERKGLKINRDYAKEYQSRKQRQELQHANLSDNDDSSSSSSSSEDEEEMIQNAASLDVDVLKTINALRNKDESIYDPNKRFFADQANEKRAAHDSHTPKRWKDVVREQIMEKMENDQEDEHDEPSRLEYDQEQKDIRKAFLDSTTNDDDDDDNMMVIKKRHRVVHNDQHNEELQKEYQTWEQTRKTAASGDLTDPRGEIQDGEKFLMDFVKNKRWVERQDDSDSDDVPTGRNVGDDDDSMEEVDKADDFEAQYNFRFEQAEGAARSGADFSIVGYARSGTVQTLRRSDDKRRQKRLERKERKTAERKAKEEQLRRLKNAKREELQTKLQEIKQVLGTNNKGDELDEDAMMKLLEGDFDPEKFESIMEDTYGDDYYEKEETEWKSDADVRKSLLEEEDDLAEEEEDEQYEDVHDDADWDDDDDLGGAPEGESRLEQKLREKVQDELYRLDYEDIVAGMPTRFKYRKVEANNYGLTAQEILSARDTTLKSFVSLKKMAPYRDEGEHTVGSKKRRRFRERLVEDLQEEGEGEEEATRTKTKRTTANDGAADNEEEAKPSKKRRRKKKGKKGQKAVAPEEEKEAIPEQDTSPLEKQEQTKDKKKKKRKKKDGGGLSKARMAAYGLD